MRDNFNRKIIALGIILLFIAGVFVPCSQSLRKQIQENSLMSNEQIDSSTENGTITCYTFGKTSNDKQEIILSTDEATLIFEKLDEMKSEITQNPYSKKAQSLKISFVELLDEKGLLTNSVSKEAYLSLLNPKWVQRLQNGEKQSIFPQPFANRGTTVLCSVGGQGRGLLVPLFLLPRPRVAMLWLGDGVTLAANLLTSRGYAAGGFQTGFTLGFMGIGISYALPGYTIYGFIGYALLATTTAEYVEHYPPNRAPEISDIQPADEEEEVPSTLSDLQFRIQDSDGDLMKYSVTTDPDIGSATGTLKTSGVYKVPLSGLENNKIYRWTIEVTDGKETISEKGCFFTQGKPPFHPFNQGWIYRKKITINHTQVYGDLTEFPILISVVDQGLRDNAQDDGDDIIFMDNDGVGKQLAHEIEYFNGGTGALTAWVKLPTVSSTEDTILYMYYGNSSTTTQQFPEKVWNGNYEAVWHLNNDPTDTIFDSTAKNNDGMTKGGMTAIDLLDGKIGRCLDFDGIDDYISFAEFTNSMNAGTCVAWIQTTSTNYGAVWGEADSTSNKPYLILGKYADDLLTFARDIYGMDSNFQGRVSTGMNDGQWHQIIWMSRGSGNGNLFYFDGQQVSLNWQDGQDPNGIWFDDQNTNTHSIGGLDRPLKDCQWAGLLDEIRILDTPVDVTWIATEYANQNTPLDFMSFGPEESHL